MSHLRGRLAWAFVASVLAAGSALTAGPAFADPIDALMAGSGSVVCRVVETPEASAARVAWSADASEALVTFAHECVAVTGASTEPDEGELRARAVELDVRASDLEWSRDPRAAGVRREAALMRADACAAHLATRVGDAPAWVIADSCAEAIAWRVTAGRSTGGFAGCWEAARVGARAGLSARLGERLTALAPSDAGAGSPRRSFLRRWWG
jgi:hypothetical protein